MSSTFLVILPTYNERENITELIPQIMKVDPRVHVLVVDDSSPDGTAKAVEGLIPSAPGRIHLLLRTAKQGLAKAYMAGFQWGLQRNYEFLIEMDADFSHRIADLISMLNEPSTDMVVVGSRYVPGEGTANWGWIRQIISRGGSWYARQILRYPLRDWTGGFIRWHRRVLESLDFNQIQSDGYSFQIEMKFRALRKGFKVTEMPILFEDRRVGQSKMSSRIVWEALLKVWSTRAIES